MRNGVFPAVFVLYQLSERAHSGAKLSFISPTHFPQEYLVHPVGASAGPTGSLIGCIVQQELKGMKWQVYIFYL